MNLTASETPHSYFRCLTYHEAPKPWNPAAPEGHAYLAGVLQAMERHLNARDLTFYITWELDKLPSYGSDVIAIVMGDEWSQTPTYAHRVLATFKCYGAVPQLEVRPLRAPSYLNMLLTAKYLQVRLHSLWNALPYQFQASKRALQGKSNPPIYDLPLGYGNQLDLPVTPINERSHDIFFAGSIEQGGSAPIWSPRYWIRSPKVVARNQMLDALNRLEATHPSLNTRIHTNNQFVLNALTYGQTEPGEVLNQEEYSKALMDTKICLVPRGTSAETFRFFEGLRYGCVCITERLPNRWFYDGAPVLQVDHWSELTDLVPALLDDLDRMERLHQEALDWWNDVCCEEAVGRFMAECINSLKKE